MTLILHFHLEMRTRVEFRSSKLPPYEGEEEQINPGLWGRRLAGWLKVKLGGLGIQATEIVMGGASDADVREIA